MTVHVVHVAQPTSEGVARCVVGLVQDQVSRGLRVSVVCPDTGWLAVEAAAAGAQHIGWRASRNPGPSVVGETLALRRILRSLGPDLLHLHSAKAGLAGRLAVRGRVPTIYQPHAWSFLAVGGPVRWAAWSWERWALGWTGRVVCVSNAERVDGSGLGERFAALACVVPNGVDVERFAPRDRSACRSRLGLPEGPLAVCIGRLSEQKGQDVLLQAWPEVLERVPTARLALVGTGPWSDRLRAMADGDIIFAGNSDDPRDWYGAADVVVVPSRWEGMALVPLEAGASGRSVVISEVAGATEAVAPQAGLIVPREDAGALAAAVATRLADRSYADEEGAAARAHVERNYGLDATGSRMWEVYQEVLGTAPIAAT